MTPAPTVDDMLRSTIKVEGGYVNDPKDPGGETNHGVTVAVARRNGYLGPMKDMTTEQAFTILKSEFAIKPGFDQVALISPSIAAEMIDTGINMGPSVAGTFLQQALNALNEEGKDYPDLREDGQVGRTTRQALAAYIKKRGSLGELVMLEALNIYQGAKYLGLTRTRPEDERFIYGWLQQRVKV